MHTACLGCESLLSDSSGRYDRERVAEDEEGRLLCLQCGAILEASEDDLVEYWYSQPRRSKANFSDSRSKFPIKGKPRGRAELEIQFKKATMLLGHGWAHDESLQLFDQYTNRIGSQHKYGKRGLFNLFACLYHVLSKKGPSSIRALAEQLSVDKHQLGSCITAVSKTLGIGGKAPNATDYLNEYLRAANSSMNAEKAAALQRIISQQMSIPNLRLLSAVVVSLCSSAAVVRELCDRFSVDVDSLLRLERRIRVMLPALISHLPWSNEVNDKNVHLFLDDVLLHWKPLKQESKETVAFTLKPISETDSDIDEYIEREVLLSPEEVAIKSRLLSRHLT